jgi:sulfur carrier protein ThiS
MAQITVNTYADLRQFTGGAASVGVEIESGRTVEQVLQQMAIPQERTKIIFVNGRAAELASRLQGGERVDLFSAIGGG